MERAAVMLMTQLPATTELQPTQAGGLVVAPRFS
jgi:hypothetical protein